MFNKSLTYQMLDWWSRQTGAEWNTWKERTHNITDALEFEKN